MIEVNQCLIDWLEENKSDVKAHRILRALAEESLKNSKEEGNSHISLDTLIASATKNPPTDPKKWLDWNDTVLKYWQAREYQIIQFAKKRNLGFYPKPERISTTGYYQSVYRIKPEPLLEISDEASSEPSQEQLNEANGKQSTVHYQVAENGEVKPAWGVQWLLHDGEVRLSKRRMLAIFFGLLMLFASVVAFSYLSWIVLSVPKPITTRDLTTLISIFVVPYAVWLFLIKPWLRLFDDRIVPAPELLVSFKEKSAQLELFKDGDLRLIRLVRYSAMCPCGATIYLDDGSPDYPRRLVGRCYDSPREHVFSFDRVTQKGTVLRGPIV
jgi:hypothetical protein